VARSLASRHPCGSPATAPLSLPTGEQGMLASHGSLLIAGTDKLPDYDRSSFGTFARRWTTAIRPDAGRSGLDALCRQGV
jgi:hypothetical protein